MYEHADQTWRDQPRVMAPETRTRLAERLAEYAHTAKLSELVVVFHGGEPLLAGAATLASTAALIRSAVDSSTSVSFSMQTNGVLLDDAALDMLEAEGIGVSLSIDGPRAANDLHRLTVRGRSSFDATMAAFERLRHRPDVFSGVISVIDPSIPGRQLLRFFDEQRPPQIDFLLPDANYERPPPGRDTDPAVYVDWLTDTFDEWFDHYAHLPVRTFDQLLRSVAGLPSGTDAFGLGDVSLLNIETDGSYHDLDVLKVTAHGGTATGLDLWSAPISDAAISPRIEDHRKLLAIDGLSVSCQACPEVEVCGGGAVPHRFDADGFDHPTVYCAEMLALISHSRRRVSDQLRIERVRAQTTAAAAPGVENVVAGFDCAETAAPAVAGFVDAWQAQAVAELRAAHARNGSSTNDSLAGIDDVTLGHLATQPGVLLRVRVSRDHERGISTRSLDGKVLLPDTDLAGVLAGLAEQPGPPTWRIHHNDSWLRAPFGHPIVFEEDPEVVAAGRALVVDAQSVIEEFSPGLYREMQMLSRDVQFVRDLDAAPDKIVSFSDDVVSGCLYVSLRGPDGLINRFDLADSLIHEHRHQKLYLLQRSCRLLKRDYPAVASPWRADPRPPSGLLHAVFVFTELRRFWMHVSRVSTGALAMRAISEISVTDERLNQAWQTLDTVPLTAAGRQLVAHLREAQAADV